MTENKTTPETPSLAAEIERLLDSKTLRRSEQLRKLLAYLGQVASNDDPTVLSEMAIGTRVFGRKDFNPKLDTIVRSEMLRLRRKLDEYYVAEAPESVFRIGFDRNSYCPHVVPRETPHLESAENMGIPVPAPFASTAVDRVAGYWKGVVVGAVITAILCFLIGFAVLRSLERPERQPPTVAAHPLWAGLAGGPVEVLIGTPLFFHNEKGFERAFALNLPEDLPSSDRLLSIKPAHPYWDLWAPYENVAGAVALSHALEDIGAKPSFLAARDRSVSTLAGRRTIVIGHPRFAPLLIDLLAEADFRPSAHKVGQTFGGFRNIAPSPGEADVYDTSGLTLAQRSDESLPDTALVTSMRLPGGGEVLSIFGNRVQSGGFLMRALLDKGLLDELNRRVFAQPPAAGAARHRAAQIVLRVDYSKGRPTGAVYLTHRIHY